MTVVRWFRSVKPLFSYQSLLLYLMITITSIIATTTKIITSASSIPSITFRTYTWWWLVRDYITYVHTTITAVLFISNMVKSHKVDKIVSGSSYKTLKLWEIHHCIFMNAYKICEICENSSHE